MWSGNRKQEGCHSRALVKKKATFKPALESQGKIIKGKKTITLTSVFEER